MARYTIPFLVVLALLGSAAICMSEARDLQQAEVCQTFDEDAVRLR